MPEFKKALGDYANGLTDQEIIRLKKIEEKLADLLIEHILAENSQKHHETKNPHKSPEQYERFRRKTG